MSVEVKPKVENGQLFKWERTHTKQVQKWFWFVTFQVFFCVIPLRRVFTDAIIS